MERPLPFITTDEDGKLSVNSDVIMPVLSRAKEPVSIVSIVGKYRTGKSYILNRIFNENAGFSLGETTQSKTKGIWIWARPHPLDPKRTLLLLDTEGLYDVEKGDDTHDMQLFSLALLLSNCLVFNATGALDDTIIQQLHLVTGLTERIKIKDSEEEQSGHFSEYFPAFFLLLRDFFLELTVDNKPCSPDEYMENALKLKKGFGKKVNTYNEPRECIRGFFKVRKCHTLCKPVDNDQQLRNLDKLAEGEIKQEFLDAAKNAIDDMLKEAKPFTVDGDLINGPRFIELAGMYVEAINNNGIPCIASAMELLKSHECQRAVDEALAIFNDVMDNSLKDKMPVEDDYLSDIQKTAHTAAMAHYSENSLFDKEGNFMKTLGIQLEERYEGYKEQNNNISRMKCNELLEKCFHNVKEKITSGKYMVQGGYKMYQADRDQAVKTYTKAAKEGTMGELTFNLFMEKSKTEENAIINADKALSSVEKELAKENEERKRQEDAVKAAKLKEATLMAELDRKNGEQAEMVKNYEQDFEKHQREMQEQYASDMQKNKSEYERLKKEGADKQAEMLEQIMNDNKEDRKQKEEDYKRHRDEIEDYKIQQNKMFDVMAKDKEASKQQNGELQEELKNRPTIPIPIVCCVM